MLPSIAMGAEGRMSMFVITAYWLLTEALVERPSLEEIASGSLLTPEGGITR